MDDLGLLSHEKASRAAAGDVNVFARFTGKPKGQPKSSQNAFRAQSNEAPDAAAVASNEVSCRDLKETC
jgi:hypothetical protein